MPARKLPPDETVTADYRSGLSSGQIAEKYNVSPATVISLLRRVGEPRRDPKEYAQLRSKSGRNSRPTYWKGKKQTQEHVERRISKIRGEKHGSWRGGTSDPRRYRGVIEKKECARCKVAEKLAIHHLNDDHYDNRIENLQVLCVSCHASVHRQAYWDAKHAGETPPKSNAPINWKKKGGVL